MRARFNWSALRPAAPVLFLGLAGLLAHTAAAQSSLVPFTIAGGKVKPHEDFVAKVTVLGSKLTSSNYGYDYKVGVRVHIGDAQFDPFGDFTKALQCNVNDDDNPREWITPGQFRGDVDEIGIVGRSWCKVDPEDSGSGAFESDWEVYTTHAGWGQCDCSSVCAKRVIVLRDGDPVPDVPGGGGQPSVADYIKDYVDKTTTPYKMKLSPKQVIFAIELGNKPISSPRTDYQDLVILVTVAADLVGADAEGFATD